jgi:hypothetical protein
VAAAALQPGQRSRSHRRTRLHPPHGWVARHTRQGEPELQPICTDFGLIFLSGWERAASFTFLCCWACGGGEGSGASCTFQNQDAVVL